MALEYDLHVLGWYNFERLCQGLLKAIIGPGVSAFGGSKDAGRDACLYNAAAPFPTSRTRWRGNWIFQVKFVDVTTSGEAGARRRLKSALATEIQNILVRATSPQVRKMSNVDNYILMTNVPITAELSAQLTAIAAGQGFTANFHVLGGKDICDKLRRLTDLRRSFPQLLGLADIEQIVSRHIRERSSAYINRYQKEMRKFVRTEAYERAWTVLRERYFAVLDGPPEVGKSFICAALALVHASRGFEIIEIATPDELWDAHKWGKKQLFVADDAIGTIALERTRNIEWERSLKSVTNALDKKHLMIWTARRYILEAALESSKLGSMGGGFPEINEVIVQADTLTEMERAEILYKHARVSRLSDSMRKLVRENARNIVNHPNYHPERIRALVEDKLTGVLDGENWNDGDITWRDIHQFLRDPGKSWGAAFDALSEEERTLLVCLLDFSHGASIEELEAAYNARRGSEGMIPFAQCAERLEQSFIRRTWGERIDFQHPSVRDMLIRRLKDVPSARKQYIARVSTPGLPGLIESLSRNKEADEELSAASAEDREHGLKLSTDQDVDALIERLSDLHNEPARASAWDAILGSCRDLLPRDADGATLEPNQIDLDDFQSSPGGKVIGAVLKALNSDHNSEALPKEGFFWAIRAGEKFYELAPYVLPAPHLMCLREIAARASFSERYVLRMVRLLRKSEPMIFLQVFSREQVDAAENAIEGELEKYVTTAVKLRKDGPASRNYEQEYDAWYSAADDLKGDLWYVEDALSEKSTKYLDQLRYYLEQVPQPFLTGGDDGDLDRDQVPQEYWTIERLFEDL